MTDDPIDRLARTATWAEASVSGAAVDAALDAARHVGAEVHDLLRHADQVIFAGAGSSYYLAQAAAWAYREILGRPATAAPLSDVLLRPGGIISAGPVGARPIVIFSRSGSTSEAVALAERGVQLGHPVVAVTCRPGSPMALAATTSLVSPLGDETAIVMTRSFTSMLTLMLRVIAGSSDTADARRLAADLDALPDRWTEAADATDAAVRVATAAAWTRVVILGGGAAFAIASEAGLKLTETGRIPVDTYQPLEFRHGPISVIEPGVLVVGLIGGEAREAEEKVVHEALALGASAWLLGRVEAQAGPVDPPDGAFGAPGSTVRTSLGIGLHDLARLPLSMPPIQALALSIAIARGCDPDVPRHLDQVVLLDP